MTAAVTIATQRWAHKAFYIAFACVSIGLLVYYLSYTLVHPTFPQQFPINSFSRLPLTIPMFAAEIFSFSFGLYFVYLLLRDFRRSPTPPPLQEKVALLVPVYNEPTEIIERTIYSCMRVRGDTVLYLLDDSTDETCKRAADDLGLKFGCTVVRRKVRVGYKAGNINHAIAHAVYEPYFAIFDSDQAPKTNFIEETLGYFADPKVGFVQVPQYYTNDGTPLERAAKVGTNIFFHAQCASKAADGALPFCGTNAIIRTDVFRSIKGFSYYSSTEDIDLGLRINQAGYIGVYVPKILVEGYGPRDFLAYTSQQYRWANGNLAILRESWLSLLFGNFSLRQQIHTFFTLGWWLIGLVNLIYVFVLAASLVFGLGTHHAWLPTFLIILLYFNVIFGIFLIYTSLHNRLDDEKASFGDALLQYSLITNSLFIYSRAAINALFRRYVGFVRTNKNRSSSSWRNVRANLLLATLCFGLSVYALFQSVIAGSLQELRTFLPISLWLLFYSLVFFSSLLFVGTSSETSTKSEVKSHGA